jgi:hypothetical protein
MGKSLPLSAPQSPNLDSKDIGPANARGLWTRGSAVLRCPALNQSSGHPSGPNLAFAPLLGSRPETGSVMPPWRPQSALKLSPRPAQVAGAYGLVGCCPKMSPEENQGDWFPWRPECRQRLVRNTQAGLARIIGVVAGCLP